MDMFHDHAKDFAGLEEYPGEPKDDAGYGERKAVFSRAADYVRQHRNRRITLEDLERATGCSRFQLIRIFRSEIGATPHAYVMQMRLHEAQLLLAKGESAAEVAAELGFVDQSHLIRRFKCAFGLTPYAFTQQMQRRIALPAGLRRSAGQRSSMDMFAA